MPNPVVKALKWAGSQDKVSPMIGKGGREILSMIGNTPLVERPPSEGGGFMTGMQDYASENLTAQNAVIAGGVGGVLGKLARVHPAALAAMVAVGLGEGAMHGKAAYDSFRDGDMRGAGRNTAAALGTALDFSRAPAATPIGRNEETNFAHDLRVGELRQPDPGAMNTMMQGYRKMFRPGMSSEIAGARIGKETIERGSRPSAKRP